MDLILVDMFWTDRNQKVVRYVGSFLSWHPLWASVSTAVFSLSTILHLVILVRITLTHSSHLRPVHIFQINYFLGLFLLCISGKAQLYFFRRLRPQGWFDTTLLGLSKSLSGSWLVMVLGMLARQSCLGDLLIMQVEISLIIGSL